MSTSPNTNDFISFRNVSLAAGNSTLLADVSFSVAAGDAIAIVGPNGAGKTSLIKCILRFYRPCAGEVRLQDKNLAAYDQNSLARLVSYVPQSLPTNIPFTLREFVSLSRRPYYSLSDITDKDGDAIVQNALELTAISHLSARRFHTLSGGERQKANIAAALAQQAPVLLLDEPTAELDPRQREEVQRLLAKINSELNTTIIVVTHDLNWAAMNFTRMIGISQGRILLDAQPKDFMTTSNLHALFGATWEMQNHPQNDVALMLPHYNSNKTTNS